MQTNPRLATLLLILGFSGAAFAQDAPQPAPQEGIILLGSSKAVPTDTAGTHPIKGLETDRQSVRLAMCGVEADAGRADLDAGLIDFNNPDPARAGGRAADEKPNTGRNVPDYRSSVFLGMTVGYHF